MYYLVSIFKSICVITIGVWSVGCANKPIENFSVTHRFIAMGDVPYKDHHLIIFKGEFREKVNAENGSFIIHVGDIKGGSSLCTDDLIVGVRDEFNKFADPLIYTPGDNEWTDCHRPRTRNDLQNPEDEKYTHPVERLNFIRKNYFTDSKSLGQRKLKLNRQSSEANFKDFRENAMWEENHVLFATIHIVGSNNNYKGKDESWKNEFTQRGTANKKWLKEVFTRAEGAGIKALVLAFHAAIDFEKDGKGFEGFKEFRNDLTDYVQKIKKPVLAIHGDEHKLRIDRPMPIPNNKYGDPVDNFFRLEVPGGYNNLGYVVVEIDLSKSNPFRFRPEIVK